MMKNAWGGDRVAPGRGAEISFSDNGGGIQQKLRNIYLILSSQLKSLQVAQALAL